MNDIEFASFRFLKLKHRKGDQINHVFAELLPSKKLGRRSPYINETVFLNISKIWNYK